jgi:hypothetical protein
LYQRQEEDPNVAKKTAATKASSAKRSPRPPGASRERLRNLDRNGSRVVRDAALLLDQEISAGIVAAKRMQKRLQQERRIDPADFQEALQRFQGNGHEVIDILNEQVSRVQSRENGALVKHIINNSHDVLDLAVQLVKLGGELANEFVESKLPKPDPNARRQRSG